MEELPSSREDEGILEDADATTEGDAVEVQVETTRPLSQTSAKKGVVHVPIAMERLIASTVGNKATGQTCPPLQLEEQQSQLQMKIVVEEEAADEGKEDAKEKGGFVGIQVAMLQGK